MRTRRARGRTIAWAMALAVPVLLVALAAVSIAGSAVALTSASAATPEPTPSAPDDTVAPVVEPEPAPPPSPEPPPPPDPLRPECAGATVMSVWAHTDDDLLFGSGPLRSALDAGGCVRTVFLTDGDAGRGADYIAARHRGIQSAYDVMRGGASEWTEHVVPLDAGAIATVRSPVDDPRVSLVYLRLPDGGPAGEGHAAMGWASLAKLAGGAIADIGDTTGAYRVTWDGLVGSVAQLVNGFAPHAFYTHIPGAAHALAAGDHSDHAVTGTVARTAWQHAGAPGTIGYGIGYQISGYAANVTGEALDRKLAAFIAYAAHDPVVSACRDVASCTALRGFGGWITREYLVSEAELGIG